jgi:hypothetical protein
MTECKGSTEDDAGYSIASLDRCDEGDELPAAERATK